MTIGEAPIDANLAGFNTNYSFFGGFFGIQGVFGTNCISFVNGAFNYVSQQTGLTLDAKLFAFSLPEWQAGSARAILNGIQQQNGGETVITTQRCGDFDEYSCTITGKYSAPDANGNRTLLSDTWTSSSGAFGNDVYLSQGNYTSTITNSDSSGTAYNVNNGVMVKTDTNSSGKVLNTQTINNTTNVEENTQTDELGTTVDDTRALTNTGGTQYEQITNTTAAGAVTATISGQGAEVNLNNAIVTLTDGASATITGTNNIAVNELGHDSLSLASADHVSVSASGYSLTASSGNLSVSITGVNNTVTVNGVGDTVVVNGDNNNTIVTGNNDFTLVSGSSNTTIASGDRDYTESTGSFNTTISAGNDDSTISRGNSDITISYGSADTTISYGYGDNTQSHGYGDNTQSIGDYDTTLSYGNYDTTLSYGYGDNTQAFGTGDYTVGYGTYDTTLAYGDYDTTISYGYGDNTQSHGYGDNTQSFGDYDTTLSYGHYDTTLSYGNNNTTESMGNNDVTQSIGNGNETCSMGSGDTTVSIGNNNTTESMGNNDVTQSVGDANTTMSMEDNDTTQSVGNSNFTCSEGTGSITQSIGNGIETESLGDATIAVNNIDNSQLTTFVDNIAVDTSYFTPVYTPAPDYSAYFGESSFSFSFSGFGFAGKQSTIDAALALDVGSVAQAALSHGDTAGAAAAEAGRRQSAQAATLSNLTSGKGSYVLEGAHWDKKIITWSLASSEGATSATFSGYMDKGYETDVQQAFATWSNASGLTFQEVDDSAQSDIRIGFGQFDTANSGVIGLTSFEVENGSIQSNTIIRLEDTAEDALMTGADGHKTYAGTEAEFSQVLLHEIGHALGLASNADANSVMYYELISGNRSLNETDMTGIQAIYGGGSSAAGSADQLVQAMASFAPQSAAQTALFAANDPSARAPLLAAAH